MRVLHRTKTNQILQIRSTRQEAKSSTCIGYSVDPSQEHLHDHEWVVNIPISLFRSSESIHIRAAGSIHCHQQGNKAVRGFRSLSAFELQSLSQIRHQTG